jgi:tetratricopeptide (TPR) repeat protein
LTGDFGFTPTAKEIVVHNLEEQQHKTTSATGNARYQTSQGQSTAIQKQVEKTTRGLWVLTAVILIGVAVFIFNKRFGGAGSERQTQQTIKQSVLNHVQVGHYQDALKDMKSVFTDPTQAGDLAIYYGSLLIQVEGQTVLGRRLLNQVVATRRPELKQAYTGLGIADLIDGQLDSAQENFNKALAIDNNHVPALVNMSALHLQKGDYVRAKSFALKALQISPFQGEALLSLAEAQLYLYKVNSNAADLEAVNKRLKEFYQRHYDFSTEVGFYSLYYDFLKNDRGLEDKIQAYLDRDPELTENHRHNVFIYKGRTQWKVIARFCEQIGDKLGDGARIVTFLASCHAHEGRWDTARRDIERAVHQSPKDPLIQAWYSYVLKQSSDPEQASVILGRANEYNRHGQHVLPLLLQARFCQNNNDVECARENWQRIYEYDLDYLPGISGLAWATAQKNFS